MQVSPLATILETFLVQHAEALSALGGELSKFVGAAQGERLALYLEHYLDQASDERREIEALLAHRGLKPQHAAGKVLVSLLAEAASAQDFEVPAGVHDIILARAFLRIQHCQIAALGVLQAIAEQLEDAEALAFAQEALAGQIDAEETLSALLENGLAASANE
jgi:ferritin-like metal-binding protein YciE